MVALPSNYGPFLSNPSLIPRRVGQASAAGIVLLDQTSGAGATVNCTSASFWTRIAARGATRDAAITADTYYQLANLTGPGLYFGAVGPTGTGGAETTTQRLTVDGLTPDVTAVSIPSIVTRAVWGEMRADSHYLGAQNSNLPAGNNGAVIYCIPPNQSKQAFAPGTVLYFARTLVIEMKHSVNVTGTANNERVMGCMYQLATSSVWE